MDKILRTIYVQLFIFTCLKLHYCMTESASRRDGPILTARDFQRFKLFFLGVLMDWDEKNLTNIQPSWPHAWSKTYIYYMAKSARGQDEVTPTFWLATRASKMGPSRPRGISRVGPTSRKKTFSLWPYNKSLIDQACSVEIAGYPVILTSSLVNRDN